MVSNKNALDIVKNKINMKKLRYYAFAFFMVLGVSFFSACSEDEKEKEKFISTILTDSEGTLVLNIGETKSLFVTIPKDKTDKRIVWESSNEKVATIENGVVTAVSVGSAVIKATLPNEQEVSYNVLVYAANSVVINSGEEVWPIDKCINYWYIENYEDGNGVYEYLTFYPNKFELDEYGGISSEGKGEGIIVELDFEYYSQNMEHTPLSEGWKIVQYASYQRKNCEETQNLFNHHVMMIDDDLVYIKKDGDNYELLVVAVDSSDNSVILHYKGKIEDHEAPMI